MVDLLNKEVSHVVGARFCPGITRRLNSIVKPIVENGVARDIGKAAESIGREAKKAISELEVNVDMAEGEVKITPKMPNS